MIIKREYITISEREAILLENSNLYLIEEQNIIDGNFLIFSDTKPIEAEIIDTKDKLIQIQQDNLILMDALATVFEEVLLLREQLGVTL